MPSKTPVSAVRFHHLTPGIHPKQRRKLKSFIISMFKKEKTAFSSLSYVFCTDKYLLTINRQFLKHDYYTDIISFDLAEKNEPINGEVYISLDRVQENAHLLNQPFVQELHRVIFHGALHFCGYNDKKEADTAVMRRREDYYLKAYFMG